MSYPSIIRNTNGKQKVVCAAKTVNKPSGRWIPLKNITIEIPMITSGKTIGRYVSATISFLPRNLYQLTPIEAIVPRIVETAAEDSATIRLFKRAAQRLSDSQKSFLYQIKLKPVNSAPLLQLKE